ncbi:hypothetical protein MUP29_11210 [bacterium]|nr:hypothetical protein [bacterium]
MRQKKGIRAGVLTLLLLLLAIGTFDSRHGNLAARAESRDITSDGNMNYWGAEANLPAERLATAQAPPQASPKSVGVERVVKVKKVVKKNAVVEIEVPVAVEIEKIVQVAENVQVPVGAKPTPTPRELPDNGADDSYFVKKPDPVQEPEPKPDTGVDFGPGDESGPEDDGDGNKGHGNDEDGYDEGNPGGGGFGGVGSSNGRSGHGGSGGSGGRGNSGGSKGRG